MSSSISTRPARATAVVCVLPLTFLSFAMVSEMQCFAPREETRAAISRIVPRPEEAPRERATPAAPDDPSVPGTREQPPPVVHEPTTLLAPGGEHVVLIPAKGPNVEALPSIFTMLHGMCDSGENMCEAASALATPHGILVCPSGNVACGDGASDWHGSPAEKATFIDGAMASVEARLGATNDRHRRDVLMGFSRGAFVARDIAYASHGRWVGLVLIGAAMTPDADKLAAAGIERVVLASGEYDGAHKQMVDARARLCAAGIPARFVSLGPIYHWFPSDIAARLGDSLDWVREPRGEERACSS